MYAARFFMVCSPDGVIRMHSPLPDEADNWERAMDAWETSSGFLRGVFEFENVRLSACEMVGGGWFHVEVEVGVAAAHDKLTRRQLEIARYAVVGATAREIAAELGLSVHTVRSHMKDIYERLEVASRVELAHALRVAV